MTTLDSMNSSPNHSGRNRRQALLGLLLIVPVPTIGVWFAAFGEQGILGSLIWAVAKVILFLGPALWWFGIQKNKLTWPRLSKEGLGLGMLTGFILGSIIFLSYWFIARPLMDFSSLGHMLSAAGIDSLPKYIGLVLYLSLINSLIEEYVFRWFIIEQLKKLVPAFYAVALSGLIFTVHHTVVLVAYVPWYFNMLASLGVFTGGLLWSYLYYRYQQLWPAYLSHIGADIGVFLVGYHALFGQG